MKKILLQNIYVRLATAALLLFTIFPAVTKGQCPVPTISASGPTTFCEGKSVVLSLNGNSSHGSPWTKKADVGGRARAASVGFSINGKGYIGTGQDNIDLYTKDFWEYDPAADTWTQKADFGGVARNSAVGFSIGSKGYIGTGTVPFSRAKDFWEYDPLTNIWIQKADFGGTPREYATGFSAGGKGYIGTGTDASNSFTKDLWEYDPAADTWTRKADFGGTARNNATGFGIGSKGYIGTGGDVNNSFKDDFWEYDPSGNIWTRKANLGGAGRRDATGLSIGNKGYIGLGGIQDGVGASDEMWEYDPTTDNWTQRENLPGGKLVTAVGFSIGSKGYIGTGYYGQHKSDFWEYDPAGSTGADDTYLWSTGETTPAIVVSSTGIYTLRVTNASGCSQVSAPVEVKVESVLPPHITSDHFSPGGDIYRFCEGETADFTAVPANPDPEISYLWSNGETTQTITVGVSGDLYVTTTDQNGCSATSGYVYVFVEDTPEISGIYSEAPDCSGTNGLIAIFVTEPSNISYYTIDGFATTSSGSDFYGLSPGTYLIGVQSDRGCRSEITSITLDPPAYSEVHMVCQRDLEVSAGEGACSADVVVNPPSASGGCGELTITSSHPEASFPLGITTVTWTAKDSYGQTFTCEQLVTVLDKTPPSVSCPADIIVEPTSLAGAKVNFSKPTVTDNCSGSSLTQIAGPPSGSVFPIGITNIIFKATDASGNSATCTFTIRVVDPYCSENGSTKKVYVCHKGKTICVSVNALGAHLGHGDQLGHCPANYTKPSVQPVVPGISVYPNPTKGQFTVQLNNIKASDASLLILDATGRVIERRSITKAGFQSAIPVTLAKTAAGIYVVRLVSKGETYITKIVLE